MSIATGAPQPGDIGLTPAQKARFDRKWRDDPSGCRVWIGARNQAGYGIVQISNRKYRAHRVAFQLANGPVADEVVIRHKCDNPPCVNPDHLEPGTRGDNNRDTSDRGRHAARRITHCPQGHPYSGNNLYRNPGGFRQCRTCVNAVSKAGKTRRRRESGAKAQLTPIEVQEIRGELSRGVLSQRVIAETYGVAQPTVSAIKTNQRWAS